MRLKRNNVEREVESKAAAEKLKEEGFKEMWALKKGKQTRNTFDKETKDKLVKEGWKVVLDTLNMDAKESNQKKTDAKDVD
jgi:hypothetical protein